MSAVQLRKEPDRRTFIGGSDVAALLGLSSYRTAVDLYLEKTGRLEPRPMEGNRRRRLELGKRLEPVVVDLGIDRLQEAGHQVRLRASNRRYALKGSRFLSCEIDAELELDGELVNADAKTVHGRMRHEWGEQQTDAIPVYYTAQFQYGMAITETQRTLCLALVGLDDVALYWIDRDPEICEALLDKSRRFWRDHVQKDVPPKPSTMKDVTALYPEHSRAWVEASKAVLEAVDEARWHAQQAKQHEAKAEAARLKVGAYLADAKTLTHGARPIATFSEWEADYFELAAFRRQHPDIAAMFTTKRPQRVLRIK